jgi:hypothetical protein
MIVSAKVLSKIDNKNVSYDYCNTGSIMNLFRIEHDVFMSNYIRIYLYRNIYGKNRVVNTWRCYDTLQAYFDLPKSGYYISQKHYKYIEYNS